MITSARALVVLLPVLVLISCMIANYLTRDLMANLHFAMGGYAHTSEGLVDQGPWKTAVALAPLAKSAQEQSYLREAERLADHEVDQAFAIALRQANLDVRVLTGDSLSLSRKVKGLQKTVNYDQAIVDSVAHQARVHDAATLPALEIAKARLALENDVLNDAVDDLARQSGDQRGTIQQEFVARKASIRSYDQHLNGGGQTASVAAQAQGTPYHRLTVWFSQRSRHASIVQAQQQAERDAIALRAEYVQLQTAVNSDAAGAARVAQPNANPFAASPTPLVLPSKSRLKSLNRLSAQSSILRVMGDRLQTQQQLSAVYDKWAAQVTLQRRIVYHLVFESLAWIAFILLCCRFGGFAGTRGIGATRN